MSLFKLQEVKQSYFLFLKSVNLMDCKIKAFTF